MTLWFFGKAVFVITVMFSMVPVLVIGERRISAFIQGRVGPNRVGPQGLFQPVADIVKFIMKEDIIPLRADRFLFVLGPLLVFMPPAIGMCVVPFGNQIGDEPLQVVNIGIGLLFVMSILSVGVYGIVLGGWASHNKYSLLGSLRASAQLISYELSLGLTLLLVVMMAESVDMQVIVANQVENGWGIIGGGTLWALPCGLVGFMMLFITSLAENNRLPFDMAECEAELVGGYHTEYSAMKFTMYMMGEYIAMTLMCALIATFFLGGWHMPYLTDPSDHSILGGVISVSVFLTKTVALLFTMIWIRWTLPRFRYDQIMKIGWKILLPISLVNIAILAVINVFAKGGA